MTFEQKVLQAFNIINEDYSGIISLEALGLYNELVWLFHYTFEEKSISYTYIIDHTHLTPQSLEANIQMLEALGLLRRLTRKESFEVILDPKELSEKEKLKLVEELCCAGIIHQSDKQRHIDEVARRLQLRERRKQSALEPQEFDLSMVKKTDAPVNIVRFYYKKLSDTFGDGVYISHNEKREAQVIGSLMKKWGDSPDMTRQMLAFVIEDAKARNKFREVSSMALYGCKRNWAYSVLKNSVAPNQ